MFDVTTGENVIALQDDSLSQRHDIHIRSVCFSPDGKYLATGSEDKIVTVRAKENYLIITLYSATRLVIFGSKALLACSKTVEADSLL